MLEAVADSGGSAEAFATALARGMAMFRDRGFYKRAQIAPANLALAGVAEFRDLDRLTIFADNLVPHVLRCEGVLVYDARLAAHIDAGRELRPGPQEREIRACAVHACELLAARLRDAAARTRQLAVEPRARAGVQGAPAAPLPVRVLLIALAAQPKGRDETGTDAVAFAPSTLSVPVGA